MKNLRITVTRSAGDDRAVLVLIDTDFEPDASDGSPGLRVLVNDDEAFVGVPYDLGANHPAEAVGIDIDIDKDIPYKRGLWVGGPDEQSESSSGVRVCASCDAQVPDDHSHPSEWLCSNPACGVWFHVGGDDRCPECGSPGEL